MGIVYQYRDSPFAAEVYPDARITAEPVPGGEYLLVKLDDHRGSFHLIIARRAAKRLSGVLRLETM